LVKQGFWSISFGSLQWLFFIIANTIVVPISVGSVFGLPPEEITGILRSSLIFTGIACVLQGLIGHRYPLMEGHSGVMWGLVLNLCASAASMGISPVTVGGGIATGLLLAGTVVILLSSFGWLTFIQKIFTPMVMSCFLFLLTFQLILIFFKGMLKLHSDGTLDLPVTLFSIGIAILVLLLKIKGNRVIGQFSLLIGMATGWVLYLILFPAPTLMVSTQPIWDVPIFPFGRPNLNIGIIAVTFLASFMNLSNTLASVQAVSVLLEEQSTQQQINRSFLLNGFYSIAASIMGLVAYAPFASSIGFLESSQIFHRKPFLIGGGLMAFLGLIPIMGSIMATLPVTVGNAVLFIAYLQLLGTSLKSLKEYEFNSITIHRLAIPILVGLGIMNLDLKAFSGLPILLQPLLANGFIVGMLLSIVLERLVQWKGTEK
jgi:xanthine/uracil permease